jgi:hypothetical protein
VAELPHRGRRRLLVAAGVLIAVALLVFGALRLAVSQLQSRIVGALGPRASVGAIQAHASGVDVLDLRIRAAPGWPAEDELRATRVRVVPDLRSLFGGPWRIASIRVDGAYLSALRTRDGRLRLLPGLLDETPAAGRAPPGGTATSGVPALEIASIRLTGATLAFFDGSVRQPPWHVRLEALEVEAGPLTLPALDHAIDLKLEGVVKGPQHDGRIALDGHYTPATRDAAIDARFSGVDLIGLQPYLIKVSDAGVRRGTLDLDLNASVVKNHLHAPGKVTLTNLELASGGPLATFAGVPKKAVIAALTDKGHVEIRFTLDGRLDDPAFSINENLATKIASGLAESVGVSLSGVVKGLGGVVKGLFGR